MSIWRYNFQISEESFSTQGILTDRELLHICPHKITVVPEIKPVNYEKRVRFCNWFISHVNDGLTDPKLTFFTDEADFNLSEYVNSQNKGHWNSENPYALIQLPLYDQKIRHMVCN
jgi:hypothetical protein